MVPSNDEFVDVCLRFAEQPEIDWRSRVLLQSAAVKIYWLSYRCLRLAKAVEELELVMEEKCIERSRIGSCKSQNTSNFSLPGAVFRALRAAWTVVRRQFAMLCGK